MALTSWRSGLGSALPARSLAPNRVFPPIPSPAPRSPARRPGSPHRRTSDARGRRWDGCGPDMGARRTVTPKEPRGRRCVLRGRCGRVPGTSGPDPPYGTHTIAFPAPSAGGRAPAMATHRQVRPTPRGNGKRDPLGGLPSPPVSLRGACDADSITPRHAPNQRNSESRRVLPGHRFSDAALPKTCSSPPALPIRPSRRSPSGRFRSRR